MMSGGNPGGLLCGDRANDRESAAHAADRRRGNRRGRGCPEGAGRGHSDRWLLEVLDIAYADPDAKTEDGKPATRLTFSEEVLALELQGRKLGFLKQDLEVKAQTATPTHIVHQQMD